MRRARLFAAVLAVGAGLLSGCSGTPEGSPSGTAPASSSPANATSASGTTSPDTETSVPAPAPTTSRPSPGPGQGNAELAITVIPSEGAAEVDYTLVCDSGTPAAESSHPNAAAACTALKASPAILSPSTQGSAQACTQQYGGPQRATVSGVVDGIAVDASFARTNGCEISAWEAAKDVLGSAGGAS